MSLNTLTIVLSIIAILIFFIFIRYTIYKDYISQRETNRQLVNFARHQIQQRTRHPLSVPPRYEEVMEDDILTRSRPPSYESRVFNSQSIQNNNTYQNPNPNFPSNISQI